MFNYKKRKISELEYKLNTLQSKYWDTQHELERLTADLEKLKKEDDSTPSDCTRGPWCESCEFSKAITIITRYHGYFSGQETLYFCDRGRLCKNYKVKDLAVNGHDIMSFGFSGRNVGYILDRLLNKVIDGELENDREVLLKKLGSFIPFFND